jgi:DNA-cytosine methyltransferase
MILREAGLRVGEAHLVVGGPPCQGFSTANSNRGRAEVEGDQRNDLLFEFLRVVRQAHPHFFIMENVPGLLSFNKGAYLRAALKTAYDGYYELVYGLLNAVEYGVPQFRCRFFLVGTRRDLFAINGTLASLPAPQNFFDQDLKKIELWTPAPLFHGEDLELLTHPPGIRYFPDRPVLVPPVPIRSNGQECPGRSKSFIEFYRKLRREEPDRIVTQLARREMAGAA